MITASLVVYNNEPDELKTVIKCALSSIIDTLFIIDHGDDVNLRNYVKDNTWIIYLKHENLGYGSGHNVAIQKAMELDAKYHIVLNPDIYWSDPVIETVTEYMEGHPDVGQIMPKVLYPDGRVQYLAKLLPTPIDIFIREFGSSSLKGRIDSKYALKGADYTKEMEVPNLSGCFMFLRIEVLRQIGLFDDNFFMYFEDTDLARRIGMVAKLVYLPTTTIIHAHNASHRKNLKMKLYGLKSAIRYFNKYGWIFDKWRRNVNKSVTRKYINSAK